MDDGSSRRSGGWMLATASVAFAVGLIASPWFERQVRSVLPAALRSDGGAGLDARLAERLNALEARVAAVEQAPGGEARAVSSRLAALEARTATAQPQAGGPVSVQQALPEAQPGRVAVLEQRIATLDQASTGAAVAIDRLKSDITRLDARTRQTDRMAQGARAVVVVARLRTLALAGRALDAGLVGAAATLPGVTPADAAALRQARPVATLAALQSSFEALRSDLSTTAAGGSKDSWMDRAMAEVRNLVTVQSRDTADASDAGRVSTASLKLASGDVNGAIAALERMSPKARGPADSWLKQARARQALLAVLTRIESAGLAFDASAGASS